MTKHTLFVCKSCHRSEEEPAENQPCDGEILLNTLNTLSTQEFSAEALEIKPVGCLWACSRGCVVALANPEKRTYLLVDLPPDEEYADALLQLSQMYVNHRKGAFIWDKLPKQLEAAMFACIPSALSFTTDDDSEEEEA
jgi:predicted metal-binding protein